MTPYSAVDAPLLFALAHSQPLGKLVAQRLGVALTPHEERVFDDGEHKIRPLQSVRRRDCFVLHSLFGEPAQTVNDKLNRLLFFIATLKDAAATNVTAVLPYLAYARKDRRTQPDDPVTLRYVAQLFEAVGTDSVIVLEVHNPAALQNAFRCRAESLNSSELFARRIQQQLTGSPCVVVSPDSGGVKRADLFRQCLLSALGREIALGFTEKFRHAGVLSGELLAGEVCGHHVLLFDDLISSGQTFLRAARMCRQHGAAAVWAVASHGLFNTNAADILSNPVIERIFITDSVPLPAATASALANKLEIVSCTPLLADAISHSAGD